MVEARTLVRFAIIFLIHVIKKLEASSRKLQAASRSLEGEGLEAVAER